MLVALQDLLLKVLDVLLLVQQVHLAPVVNAAGAPLSTLRLGALLDLAGVAVQAHLAQIVRIPCADVQVHGYLEIVKELALLIMVKSWVQLCVGQLARVLICSMHRLVALGIIRQVDIDAWGGDAAGGRVAAARLVDRGAGGLAVCLAGVATQLVLAAGIDSGRAVVSSVGCIHIRGRRIEVRGQVGYRSWVEAYVFVIKSGVNRLIRVKERVVRCGIRFVDDESLVCQRIAAVCACDRSLERFVDLLQHGLRILRGSVAEHVHMVSQGSLDLVRVPFQVFDI